MAASGRPLTICDLSPFYCETGGGIRTYHRAKIDWFRSQRHHRYVLVCPGPRDHVTVLAPNVTIARVYGAPVTRDADGYRLMLGLGAVTALVEEMRPDVIEAGDPWISGPLALLLRRRGRFRGVLSSFYHSDPIATYVNRWLAGAAASIFYRMQALYDVTLAASKTMQRRLHEHGVANVVCTPFGVDALFFDIRRPRTRGIGPAALLYAGRLDADKDVALLLEVVPRLLQRLDVTVTVVGRGQYQDRFARISHPRFTFHEFVRDREALARIYEASDILLAPGRFETFGLSALEAAAAGLVVVGPDAGGTGELLEQMRSPFLFERGSAAAFYDAIDRAAACDLPSMSERSRALAAGYGTWPDAIARQIAVYESMAGARSCR